MVSLASLGLFLLSGCGAAKQDLVKSTAAGVAKAVTVKNRAIVYLMAGKIDAIEKAEVTSKINARVTAINVDVGSAVKKDDPLISLDARDLQAQTGQAQAAFNSAGASYQNAKSSYERNRQLFSAGLISKSQFEGYQTALAVAEASVKSARENLELARTQLSNGTILSPISGVVSVKNINPGELATSGTPLITVVNPNTLIVNVYLPAGLIGTIKAGQRVAIKVSEVPGRRFHGQISLIGSVVDSKDKNILVKVKFSEGDPRLKPGMFAEIGLTN